MLWSREQQHAGDLLLHLISTHAVCSQPAAQMVDDAQIMLCQCNWTWTQPPGKRHMLCAFLYSHINNSCFPIRLVHGLSKHYRYCIVVIGIVWCRAHSMATCVKCCCAHCWHYDFNKHNVHHMDLATLCNVLSGCCMGVCRHKKLDVG